MLQHGDIVEQGTHEELLSLGGAYAELYNSQFEEDGVERRVACGGVRGSARLGTKARHMTAQSEAMQTASRSGDGPVRLAAFDFDGTSLDGNSPVMLVKHLAKLRMLNPTVLLRIGLWAAAYKLRLPQNEAWVRGLVFRAFAGKPKAEVDAFLHDFYDECVAPHVREQARQAMDAWREQGVTVICVSAYLRAHHRARHAGPALRLPDLHAHEGGL